MVNSRGQLEDDNLEGSQYEGDSLSEYDLPPGQREREDTLRRAGLMTTSEDEYDLENAQGEDEQGSPPRASDRQASQGDRTETGPLPGVPLGAVPGPSTSRGQEGETLYSWTGVSLVEGIKNPKKHEATRDVLDAFSGPPKRKCDPSHILLREAGWGMAQRVFDPSRVWQTKEANAFSTKFLTLIPDQKRALESDLVMETFLRDYEKTPGYRSAFEFKNKMFASMRSQRTALVPLFKLGDEITWIKRDVEYKMGSCGAVLAP